MATSRAATIAEHIGKLVTAQRHRQLTDRELLRRFTKDQDESAFSTLLHKHGPMVLNVGQRALHNAHDAEDVFQATFLVLMKKAGALSWHDSVAGWLHEVAYRLAVRAKTDALRRSDKERHATAKGPEDPVSELTVREAQTCLHDELHRLPENLRAPLVLCYLQGATQDEAARELGWAVRTFKRRLERGRTLLQQRLTRRGVTLSVALSTGLLPAAAASAGLIPSTLKAAVALASGKAAGAVPASVSALVDGAVRGMFLAKMQLIVALTLLASVLGTGIALLGRQPEAPPVEPPILQAGAATPAQASAGESAPKSVKPATDRFGDALPEHAVARMGSLRFQHGTEVERLIFSQDGAKILVNGWYTNRVFDTASGKEFKLAEGFSSNQACVAGNQVLVVGPKSGQGRNVGIWSLQTGELVKAIDLDCQGGSVEPKGKSAVLYASTRTGVTFRFLDLESGKLTDPVPVEGMGQVDQYWFSADGKRVVTMGLTLKGRRFAAWDVRAGRMLHDDPALTEPLTWACFFSADGTIIGNISGQRDQLDLYDVTTLQLSASFKVPPKTKLYSAAISPDGNLVAAAADYAIYLWDRKTGQEVRQIRVRGTVDRVIAFSPDGKRLAAGHHRSVTMYDVATGTPCHTFGHTYAIYSLLFAPDGKKLYSIAGYRDSSVRVWHPLTGELLEEWQGHTKGLNSMAMSADGRWIVTNSQDRTIRVWDRQLGKEMVRLDEKTWGHFLAFLPDGKRFVSAQGSELRLHDAATGNTAATFELPGPVHRQFNGVHLWTLVSRDSQTDMLQSIDLASGKVKGQVKVPKDERARYALAPDGKRIAVGSENGMVHVIDARTGDEYRQFKIRDDGTNPREVPTDLAFSADGELLAVGSRRGTVSLWELAGGKERASFQGHRGEVLCLAFSPDRKLLVSGGSDQTILAWDLYGLHAATSTPIPKLFDKLWDDLRHPDPVQAYPAIKSFAADAAATTAYFAKKHQPLPNVEDKLLRLWIEHLDSDNFKLREEAFRKLKAAIRQAEPLLQAALATKPSLDFSRRVQQLLAELDPAQSPDRLRWARAAEILRVLDTAAARGLLQKLER